MEGKIRAQRATIFKFLRLCESALPAPEAETSVEFVEGKELIIDNLWNKVDAVNDGIIEGVTPDYEMTIGPEVLKAFNDMEKEFDQAFEMFDRMMVQLHTTKEKVKRQAVQPLQPLQLPENLTLNTNGK